MKTVIVATAVILACTGLMACSKPAAMSEAKFNPQAATATTAADAQPGATIGGHPGNTTGNSAGNTDVAASIPQLAYDYSYGFQGSAKGIETLRRADQAACDRAGPSECQMLASTSNSDHDANFVNRSLELRASPTWLKRWQGGLDTSVSQAHVRITEESVSSEDLSLQIVDTAARMKNKQALRDRLQAIIRGGNGKISELIEAESQLAQVQADIESAQSQLAVMQKRVATVHLTLTYRSDAAATSTSIFSPVAEAWNGALRNMMVMVSLLITLMAFLLPVAIVAAPPVWWFLKRRKSETFKTDV